MWTWHRATYLKVWPGGERYPVRQEELPLGSQEVGQVPVLAVFHHHHQWTWRSRRVNGGGGARATGARATGALLLSPLGLVQAPNRFTTFRWLPMWISIFSSDIRALCSLAVAPSETHSVRVEAAAKTAAPRPAARARATWAHPSASSRPRCPSCSPCSPCRKWRLPSLSRRRRDLKPSLRRQEKRKKVSKVVLGIRRGPVLPVRVLAMRAHSFSAVYSTFPPTSPPTLGHHRSPRRSRSLETSHCEES